MSSARPSPTVAPSTSAIGTSPAMSDTLLADPSQRSLSRHDRTASASECAVSPPTSAAAAQVSPSALPPMPSPSCTTADLLATAAAKPQLFSAAGDTAKAALEPIPKAIRATMQSFHKGAKVDAGIAKTAPMAAQVQSAQLAKCGGLVDSAKTTSQELGRAWNRIEHSGGSLATADAMSKATGKDMQLLWQRLQSHPNTAGNTRH